MGAGPRTTIATGANLNATAVWVNKIGIALSHVPETDGNRCIMYPMIEARR
ncbi:hypothetical protein ANO14919_048530 [Xylariales sp. No.14919]|nr:hypothetical protein ANO14919_048530 [Xylariales sp. No.14919]